MMNVRRKLLALTSAAALMLCLSAKAEAAPIPVELVLAIDASGSIAAADYVLQRNAYATVLNSGLITTDGTIAIGVVEFGANVQTVFGMTLINSQAAKDSLIAAINGMNRNGISTGATAIGSAINAAMVQLGVLNHANANQVIDVSTDGFNNSGDNLPNAVASANAAGTVVNCLGVGPGANCDFVSTIQNLSLGGFSTLAPNFAAFEAALTRKIELETGQVVPEPASMLLLGTGLVAVVVARRRRRV